MNPLIVIFLSSFTITSYQSIPSQTDNSPFITSIGEHVCKDGVAVSQDLLNSGIVKYGDWVYINTVGFRRINDTMNPRIHLQFDVWVASKAEEKAFWKAHKFNKFKVWLIKANHEK